jgi:hypothetical protein
MFPDRLPAARFHRFIGSLFHHRARPATQA